jgi:hypothetical protein
MFRGEATMSNINNFRKQTIDPFRQDAPRTVGGTYGERVKYQRTQPDSTPPPQTPRDHFKNNAKSVSDLDEFGANADYKPQRRQALAYRPQLLDAFESGSIPRVRNGAPRPSDNALVNFLDRVIDNQGARKAAARPAR